MTITSEIIGHHEGDDVVRWHLVNGEISVKLLNLGCVVSHLFVPDRSGEVVDVVLGYDDWRQYLENPAYMGCVVGRYANRIGKGKFCLNEKQYQLAVNNGPNGLHGGLKGFDKAVWKSEEVAGEFPAVKLTHVSPDGDEGYPGTLTLTVTYSLHADGLHVDYKADCDQDTVINLTNHSYFNLAGEGQGTIYHHLLEINADSYTVSDKFSLPTGEIATVVGTPLDFGKRASIGDKIVAKYKPLQVEKGFNFNYIVPGEGLRRCASVVHPASGRAMEVWTTEPAIQLYTGNYLDDVQGKNGNFYGNHHALCLETQHYPDSPNHPHFPSTILRAGQQFRSTTIYRFSKI